MRDPFANYDAWLEEPYQRMIAEGDAYADWCEAEGLDPDDDASEDAYRDYCTAEYDPEPDYANWDDDAYWDEAYSE